MADPIDVLEETARLIRGNPEMPRWLPILLNYMIEANANVERRERFVDDAEKARRALAA